MSFSPPPHDSASSGGRAFWLVLLSRPVLGVLVVFGIVLGAAVWRGLVFIEQDLVPLVEKGLGELLNRPIQVGEVKRFSLTELEFGPSEVPAHTMEVEGQTVPDRDRAVAESVTARFNPLTLLFQRTLNLDVTLNNARVFLDEAPDGRWIGTKITPSKEAGLLKIKVDTIRATNARVELAPQDAPVRVLQGADGAVDFKDENQQFDFRGKAAVDSGGKVAINGTWRQPEETLALTARTEDLALRPLVSLLPPIPIQMRRGAYDGVLQVDYQPQKPLALKATGTVNNPDAAWPQGSILGKAKRIKGDVSVQIQANRLPILKGQAVIEDGQGQVPQDLILNNGRSARLTAQGVDGKITFLGASDRMKFDLQGKLAMGGQVKSKGEIKLPLKQANFLIQAQNVPAKLLDGAYDLPIQVTDGRVNANMSVQLRQGQRPSLGGVAALKTVDAAVTGLPQPFRQANGFVRFKGLTVTLDQVTAKYGQIPLQASGSIDPDRGYNLRANTAVLETNTALNTLGVENLPFPVTGNVQARDVRVQGLIPQPILTGQVRSVGNLTVDQIPLEQTTAQFQFVPGQLQISDVAATPVSGGSITGQAALNLGEGTPRLRASFQASRLSGDAIAKLYQAAPGFTVGLVNGTALVSGPVSDVKTAVQFQAVQGTYPTTGTVEVFRGKTYLQDIAAQIPGGKLLLDGIVAEGRFNLDANLPGLNLATYSEDLKGQLSGQLALSGPLADFSTQKVRATGALRFSEGLSLIENPIEAQVQWDGQQIVVNRATAPGFEAQGTVGAILQGPNAPQLTTLNLGVVTRDYELSQLPSFGLPQNPLEGRTDLVGTLTGTLSAPVFSGQLDVNELAVANLDFEPVLAGNIAFDTVQGLNLNLAGNRDRVQVALDANQRPTGFNIRRDQATAVGVRDRLNNLAVKVENLPLLALNLAQQLPQTAGPISGLASGTFDVNLDTYALEGQFAVEKPGVGRFLGDRLTGEVRYANSVGTLKEVILVQGPNQLQLDATLVNREDPLLSGRLLVAQARVEDILAVAQSVQRYGGLNTPQSDDFGTASDVETLPVGIPEAPLWEQLQRLAEIDALIAQEAEANGENGALPKLQDLTGTVAGDVRFSGSLNAGLTASFNIEGQNWALDTYTFDQFVAQGRYDASGLQLDPLALTSEDSLVSFSGRVGGQRQRGQLRVRNFPVATVASILQLPIDLDGQLNGVADLQGGLNNPQVEGRLTLDNGILNQAPIENAETNFKYQDARLAFNGRANIDSPEPIIVEGNVPYPLPFAEVQPDSDQVDIRMAVKDQGLALVNLFTDQIAWVDGQGRLQLQVAGTVERPLLNGLLTVDGATLQAQALSEALSDVTGSVQFNSDRISIPSLVGRYNQGQLVATGKLPLFDSQLRVDQPLALNLSDVDVDLKGLYRGGVAGQLSVTGSAISPILGGGVNLQEGQVFLAAAAGGLDDSGAEAPVQTSGEGIPIEFDQLRVSLGDNVRILQPPVLSFTASGAIALNGSLDAPRPEGRVSFEKGRVNLFTSVFRIDQRQENYAQFTPLYGLDPYLNLYLRTTVTEIVSGRTTDLNEFADLPLGSLGSVESVRVRASIQGRASQLTANPGDAIALTSSPGRSQNEILALLSGGVAQSIQSGNAEGALVNLAGSTVFNQLQGFVDDVLGSRASFRLFPLLSPTDSERGNVLDLGAEFGYDVTDRLSVSLLQVVTNTNETPQLNLSYDLSDQLRVRSSVNFDGDAVGVVEYRIRF